MSQQNYEEVEQVIRSSVFRQTVTYNSRGVEMACSLCFSCVVTKHLNYCIRLHAQ